MYIRIYLYIYKCIVNRYGKYHVNDMIGNVINIQNTYGNIEKYKAYAWEIQRNKEYVWTSKEI